MLFNIFSDKLPWFLILNWLLQTVGIVTAFIISLFYALIIAPGRTLEENLRPVTFHLHVTNSILFIIEFFMMANPTRILHFIYIMGFGILYTLFLIIWFLTGNPPVYSVLDFKNKPTTAAMWSTVAVIVLPFVFQIILFTLYRFRLFLAGKSLSKTKVPQKEKSSGSVDLEKVNSAFEK